MSELNTYRHEDIESLLMSKAYDELLPEEKSFVMQHVSDGAEYNSLRSLLLQMHELSFDAELKDPPESLETALLHGFAENAEKVRGFKQRFAPWMGWAIAATVVGFCVIFFWPASEPEQTATVEQTSGTPSQPEPTNPDSEPKPVAPKPAVNVPVVKLPAEIESMLAQVVPAATPQAPSYAIGLYEYEDAIKSVSLTQEESDEPVAPAEVAEEQSTGASEDMLMNASPAPAAATFETKDVDSATLSKQESTSSKKRISAETRALGKANRKKSRNPEALNLAQSKKLRALLRSE